MTVFGIKAKKLSQFGGKFSKSGLFGVKNGGRASYSSGQTPSLIGNEDEMRKREGIEKQVK